MTRILCATDVGLRREMNQDTYAVSAGQEEGLPLWGLVCDGMGGHAAGNVAAEIARDRLAEALRKGLRPGMGERSMHLLLETAVENAASAIYRRTKEDRALQGMGTTVVAAVLAGEELYLCHAGDSRAYLVRGEELHRLTRDHSVVQDLIDRGEITPKQALTHPERHYITKALGVSSARVRPHFAVYTLCPGDLILLCSDGLHGMVAEEELPALCLKASREDSADCLIDRANEMGGGDNVTAVLFCTDPA